MNKFKYSLAILMFGLLCNTNGQGIENYSVSNEEAYKFRVKQLSEFIDLFNNKADLQSRGLSPEQAAKMKRLALISSLFDASDPRLDRDGAEYDPSYALQVKEFIVQVTNDSLFLTKSSEQIYALARNSGAYKRQPVEFNIILQQERVGKDMLKWAIADVDADFIDFLLKDTVYLRFLPPTSDELDFKELIRALNDHDYLDQYATRDFKYNSLSVFFYLLKKGEVKIEAVLDVKYYLLEIPGWKIELTDFNRISKNSGWLISDLKKIPKEK